LIDANAKNRDRDLLRIAVAVLLFETSDQKEDFFYC